MSLVVPAVLPSSRTDFLEKLALFARIPGVTRIQIDVVDGRFATPASWPFAAPHELQTMIDKTQMLPELDRITYEIDLMCYDSSRIAEDWLTLGASRLTFHAEAATDIPKLLASARKRHGGHGLISFGLAVNTVTDLALIESSIADIEYVQFMGISRIGRQGQPFDTRVLDKIRAFHAKHPEVDLQVDGGVTLDTGKQLIALGVSSLVVGSGILRAKDPVTAFEEFEALVTPYGV